MEKKVIKSIIIGGSVVSVITLTSLFTSVKMIKEGEIGVVTKAGRFERVEDTAGFMFVTPYIGKVTKFDTKIKTKTINIDAATSDMQTVTGTATINYHLDKDHAEEIYKTVGRNYEDVLINNSGIIEHSIKNNTVKYNAENILTNRDKVATEAKQELNDTLNPKGIIIDELKLPNLDFTAEYNKAIEEKQVAEEQIKKAQKEQEKAKIEAETKAIQAEGEAKANAELTKSLSQEIIELEKVKAQLKAIEKWDGKLPSMTGDAIPFIDANAYQKTK